MFTVQYPIPSLVWEENTSPLVKIAYEHAERRAKLIDDTVKKFLLKEGIIKSESEYTVENVKEALALSDREIVIETHPDTIVIKLKKVVTVGIIKYEI